MMSKKTRAPNFTKMEKMLLIALVSKHKDIVDCKRTDAVTWKQKEEAWKQITRSFNASGRTTGIRTFESLRKLYDNLKGVCKRKGTTLSYDTTVAECNTEITECDPEIMEFDPLISESTFPIMENVGLDVKEDHTNRRNNMQENQKNSMSSQFDFEENSNNTFEMMHDLMEKEFFELKKKCYLEKHKKEMEEIEERIQYQRRLDRDRAAREEREKVESELRQKSLSLDIELKTTQISTLNNLK